MGEAKARFPLGPHREASVVELARQFTELQEGFDSLPPYLEEKNEN